MGKNDTIRTDSRNAAPESERTPAGGNVPRTSETRANARGGPDPDHHPEAAANTLTDEEAGASTQTDDEGGITPLQPKR